MTIKSVWEFIKKFYPLIFFATIVVLIVLLFSTCNRLTAEKKAHEYDNMLNNQNRTAMLDSVTKTYNKKALELYGKDYKFFNKIDESEEEKEDNNSDEDENISDEDISDEDNSDEDNLGEQKDG